MEKDCQSSNGKNWSSGLKFAGCSLFGLMMFLCPLGGGEGFNTPLSVLTEMLDKWIGANLPWLLTCLVVTAAVLAAGGLFVKPASLRQHKWLADLVHVSKVYLVTRLGAAAVALGVFFGVGPDWIVGPDVGGSMMGLGQTLIALAITLSFILPFLTDCGIMEFIGILLKPLVRPLFRVPGRASVDLIASWLSSSNTAVLITAGQYNGGFYSRREAACIMTNFSLVSIPFCLVVAETLQVADHFRHGHWPAASRNRSEDVSSGGGAQRIQGRGSAGGGSAPGGHPFEMGPAGGSGAGAGIQLAESLEAGCGNDPGHPF